ncbi:circadian clock KaiB family protein [Desulforhopalus vacuolatus]|uniref:circadian clock KaiB family protein n=1 Tax=Desulforhopalus vacuolatus TaxID=40414 RepID=UPI0019639856|nr:circadian clock KaiB family protein [Desulforhopalus vacuolatus]
MSDYVLRLYITGKTANSMRALENLKRLCREELSQKYEIVVIDILENPQLAEDETAIPGWS